MEEMGADHLTLCDTTGMAYPNQVEALLGHEVPSQIVKAGRRLDLHPVPPTSRPSAAASNAHPGDSPAWARWNWFAVRR